MNILTYILNLKDNLSPAMKKAGVLTEDAAKKTKSLRGEVGKLNDTKVDGFLGSISKMQIAVAAAATAAVFKLKQTVVASEELYKSQSVAQNKLSAIMRNTMNARKEDIQSVINLTSVQQKLGVVSSGVQLAGAQELATYLTKKDSLEKLLPVMNDMLAQQYGLNASGEQAAQVAGMLGKVMDGQVGALSRYGYKFDELQEKILKTGTEAERAAVLVDVVGSAVGGVNKALAQTPEGRLKQQADNLEDIQARFGRLVVMVKSALSPVMEKIQSLLDGVVSFFERNEEKIQSTVAVISQVVVKAFEKIGAVISWVYGAFAAFIDGVRSGNPVLVGLAAVIIAITTAIAVYKTVMGIVAIVTGAWTAAQWLLNVALTANPVGLIIAGVVALIAVITFLIVKIDGWGDAWKHTVNGAKLLWEAYTEYVKSSFNTVVQGIMIGINKIKEGWYAFKLAVGIGNSSENQKMLDQIRADTEERKASIAEGWKKTADLTKQAGQEFMNAAGSFKWNNTSLSDIANGIKNKLGISAPSIPGTAGTDIAGTGGFADGSGIGGGTGKDTASSIATGGSKTTHITINLGELVGTININKNGFRESAENMRDIVLDEMTRVLSMAQGQAS